MRRCEQFEIATDNEMRRVDQFNQNSHLVELTFRISMIKKEIVLHPHTSIFDLDENIDLRITILTLNPAVSY